MLVPNPKGNYAFVQGIAPYSAGAVAEKGFEIIHVRFPQPLPLVRGFERVKAHLTAMQRPLHAMCGMELRSPKPFTFAGFGEFNGGYIQVLKDWGLFLEETNPVARTNVAPEIGAPPVPSLYGFSYTAPSARKERTFVVAGAGELPEGSLDPADVVRKGEVTNEAMREKARFVMGLMAGRLHGMGVDWPQVTVTEIYTVHNIAPYLAGEIVRPLGRAAIHGLTWHYARPPIVTIEFEMDLRGCYREIVL